MKRKYEAQTTLYQSCVSVTRVCGGDGTDKVFNLYVCQTCSLGCKYNMRVVLHIGRRLFAVAVKYFE